ncbi:MAG: class I SAM-dependent methyltransferase [Planctomycetaceae bacterium]
MHLIRRRHQHAEQSRASGELRHPPGIVTARPWYLKYLPLKYVPGLKAFYEWLLNDLSQPVAAVPSGRPVGAAPRALEVGCATGSYLLKLRDAGWDVQGVEPGAGPVDVARAAGLNVHHGSLDSFDLNAGHFDLVAAWMVLEHVPDPRTTLRQMFDRLQPGGRLLLSVPNAGCWEPAFFGADWDTWDLPRHLHHITPKSIRRLLTECGFEHVNIQHQRTLLNVIGSLGVSMRRRRPGSRIGYWFWNYPNAPKLWLQLLLAPAAHLLAFLHQSGRLTISAIKGEENSDHATDNASVRKPAPSADTPDSPQPAPGFRLATEL